MNFEKNSYLQISEKQNKKLDLTSFHLLILHKIFLIIRLTNELMAYFFVEH